MDAVTTSAPERSGSVLANGHRLHYLEWGDTAAQPLLLLHGLSSNAHQWDFFAPALRDRYRVIALDQRGHGESEWAADYEHEHMVADVHAFARALGLGRFALLGLSLGGRIAYGYAATHPDEVDRLVIVDIGPELAPAGAHRIRAAMVAKDVFDDQDEAFRIARASNPRPTDEYLRHRSRYGLVQRDDGRWTFRFDKGLRDGTRPLKSIEPAVAWALLARIACPTLLVRGAESDILARSTAERMTAVIPDCRLVEVRDSGHPVPADNPTGFLAAVEPFLRAQ